MSNPPPGMTSPPGLGVPPGLSYGGGALPPTFPQPTQHQQQQQQQQPDLSNIGPHTSSAQIAALLSSVGNGSELNPFAPSQQPQQQQFGGFSNGFGAFGGANNFGVVNGGMIGGGFVGSNVPSSSTPCRMHQQGGCRYGATCRFTHVGPAGGGGGMGGGQNAFGNGFNGNAFGNRGNNNANANNNFGGQNFQPQQTQQQQQQQQSSQQAQQVQPQQDQLDASAVGTFNPNVPAFVPSVSGPINPTVTAATPPTQSSSMSNPNGALLQALLTQQLLNSQSGGAPNPDLDRLIISLSKATIPQTQTQQQQTQPQAQAQQQSQPQSTDLNSEFMHAQAQLASFALGTSRPSQSSGGVGGGFNNGNGGGNFSSSNNSFSSSTRNSVGGGVNYGNKHNQHHHNSNANNFQPSFHAGGNFGGSSSNLFAGSTPSQMRFYSDANNRDLRREMELFGPAHTNTTGINFDRYDDIPVEVTGNDVPGEMKAFSDFDFPDVIRQNIELSKYEKPTPIQKFALPVAFLGRDLMACAQTGSGKTAAFLLPFIAHLVINGRPAPIGGSGRNKRYMPVGLILAPTRELATQIHDESLKFTYCSSIHSVVVYGGQDIRQQFRELDRGCDIIIATPGRLMDFVERGRISLSQISYLCLDEADRMLDMGFEPQIRNIVLQQDMSENRQTLMFSATFPKEIQRLAQDFLYNYIFIAVGRVGASSDFITQTVDWVDEENKRNQLMQYLPKFKGLTLIFVTRKKSADLLETYLNREGFRASSIHGDRSQHERESALHQFRNGRCPILVATDVAARGLDISNVTDVVNFDFPQTIDDYVHRIGRTGRAGNTGNAWSFVNESSSHLFKDLYEMLHENKQVVPQWLSAVVESRGGMRTGGGGGGRKFGGRDYRKGGQGYGSHSGGRGGMAQHNMGKRFQSHPSQSSHHPHQSQSQMGGFSNFGFPNAAGGPPSVMRPNQGGFNPLAAAMAGRSFPQAGPTQTFGIGQ